MYLSGKERTRGERTSAKRKERRKHISSFFRTFCSLSLLTDTTHTHFLELVYLLREKGKKEGARKKERVDSPNRQGEEEYTGICRGTRKYRFTKRRNITPRQETRERRERRERSLPLIRRRKSAVKVNLYSDFKRNLRNAKRIVRFLIAVCLRLQVVFHRVSSLKGKGKRETSG